MTNVVATCADGAGGGVAEGGVVDAAAAASVIGYHFSKLIHPVCRRRAAYIRKY